MRRQSLLALVAGVGCVLALVLVQVLGQRVAYVSSTIVGALALGIVLLRGSGAGASGSRGAGASGSRGAGASGSRGGRQGFAPRDLVVLALLCALVVIGRVAFTAVPFFKPIAALVIIAGVGFGAPSGFFVGAFGMFMSNFFFGQGPWTVWQMVAYGLLGALSGWLFYGRPERQSRWILAIWGACSSLFLVGPLLDLSTYLSATAGNTGVGLWATLGAGFAVNVVVAASAVLFLFLLARPLLEQLHRMQVKYGILCD